MLNASQQDELEILSRPLIKWLNDNCHPHIKVIVDSSRAELVEGIFTFRKEEFNVAVKSL